MKLYKKDFIEKVMRVYGDNERIVDCVKDENIFLREYITPKTVGCISASEILSTPLEELFEKAKKEREKEEIRTLWINGNAFSEEILQRLMCPIEYIAKNPNMNICRDKTKICSYERWKDCTKDCTFEGPWNIKWKDCWEKYYALKESENKGTE